MAGVNTAITGVGTVTGGVALGVGLAKKSVDAKVSQIESTLQAELDELDKLAAQQTHVDIIPDYEEIFGFAATAPDKNNINSQIEQDKAELEKLNKKSKTLGHIRTGTLAGTTVLDTTGAVISATNRIDEDLQLKIDSCVSVIKELSYTYKSAMLNNPQPAVNSDKIENIIRTCGEWEYINLSKINKRATGATISGAAGAAMALVGTVTSASANSDGVRNDNSEQGKNKEKNLNSASNVLSAGATISSGAATVFNATQISAIKKALDVATKCEEALAQ